MEKPGYTPKSRLELAGKHPHGVGHGHTQKDLVHLVEKTPGLADVLGIKVEHKKDEGGVTQGNAPRKNQRDETVTSSGETLHHRPG